MFPVPGFSPPMRSDTPVSRYRYCCCPCFETEIPLPVFPNPKVEVPLFLPKVEVAGVPAAEIDITVISVGSWAMKFPLPTWAAISAAEVSAAEVSLPGLRSPVFPLPALPVPVFPLPVQAAVVPAAELVPPTLPLPTLVPPMLPLPG